MLGDFSHSLLILLVETQQTGKQRVRRSCIFGWEAVVLVILSSFFSFDVISKGRSFIFQRKLIKNIDANNLLKHYYVSVNTMYLERGYCLMA